MTGWMSANVGNDRQVAAVAHKNNAVNAESAGNAVNEGVSG